MSILAAGSVQAFELTSNDIQEAVTQWRKTFECFISCDGDNLSPQLMWKDAPVGTKQLMTQMHQPKVVFGIGRI